MREIKFRAWDKIHKVIIQVDTVYFTRDGHKGIVPFKIEGITLDMPEGKEYTLYEGEFDLLELTGLKDKNGKEIYEGDIVKLYHSRGRFASKGNVEIVWGNCEFSAKKISKSVVEDLECLGNYRFEEYDIEIIGNIYENPELLKKEKGKC